jgi:hypothetical protein
MSKQPNTQYITPDKRIISLDLQELNLLQSIILLMPTPDVALKIKKQFGIPLSVTEIVSEMRNIHSPLYRYLKALQMSIVARCLMLREENFKEMLKHLRAKSEHELMLIERKNLKRKLGALFHKYVFRKYIESLNQVAVESMQIIPLPLKIEARDYLIEAHKSNLLRFYLKHAPANMVSLILEIVETQVRMIRRNYELLDSIRSWPDLSSKQKEDLDEWEERYANHLLASEPEKMERVLSHLDLDDHKVLGQTLNLRSVNESILGVGLQSIVNKKNLRVQELNSDLVNEIYEEPEAVLQNFQYTKLNYQIIREDINDRLAKIVDINKDILLEGLEEIVEFVEILSSAISKERYRKNNPVTIYNAAVKLVDELSEIEEIDYSDLIALLMEKFSIKSDSVKLKKPQENNKVDLQDQLDKNFKDQELLHIRSMREYNQEVISVISNLVNTSQISEDLKRELEKILQTLDLPFNKENSQRLLSLINEVQNGYPDFSEFETLFEIITKYVDEQNNLIHQPG